MNTQYCFVLITVYCKTNQLKHGWTIMICHFFQLFFLLFSFFLLPCVAIFFFFLSIYCMKIKKHTTRSIVENYWLVIFCFCFKESFCKDWWALFNTLKRVRLGLRALGRAFSGYPTGFVFGLPAGFDFSGLWAGLHWFFFLMTRTRNLQLFFECEV